MSVARHAVNRLLAYLLARIGNDRLLWHVETRKPRLIQRMPTRAQYQYWIRRFDRLSDDDRTRIAARIAVFSRPPVISVVMPVFNPPAAFLMRTIASVREQFYPHWELCIADDASTAPHVRPILDAAAASDPRIKIVYRAENGHISRASNSALALATGEFVALLDHDDELAPHALYLVAEELTAHPDADLVYSDEDKIDADGVRFAPYFKPDWNPDLFLAQNSISHLGVYRTALIRAIGGFREGFEGSQDYDLALRATEQTTAERIRHIPHVLYHWRAIPGSAALRVEEKPYAVSAARRAVADYLARTGRAASVEPSALKVFQRVRYSVPSPEPPVSILIPTRDRVDLVERCISGILERTDYRNLEILIVDNGSQEEDSLRYLVEIGRMPRVRVLRHDAAFNFSALNNVAVRQVGGEILVLLNNDTDVIHPDWLMELVANALRPDVGAVGARLLYPNGAVQHAGVVLGLGGVAGHAFKRKPARDPGHGGRAQLQQDYSAVTAACLAIRKGVYDEIGGLNERDLPVAFNDVDLCLRLRSKGYRIVWTPYAVLYHHESATRGTEATPARRAAFEREIKFMKDRWGEVLRRDPCYNPNLSLNTENFDLAFPPRAIRPWRDA